MSSPSQLDNLHEAFKEKLYFPVPERLSTSPLPPDDLQMAFNPMDIFKACADPGMPSLHSNIREQRSVLNLGMAVEILDFPKTSPYVP